MAKMRTEEIALPDDQGLEAVANSRQIDTSTETPYIPSDVLGDETTKNAILDYLCNEILDVRDGPDREALLRRWEKWRRLRRARPESEERSTPWIRSANSMPPLTAQKVNTIYAKELSAFMGKKPPVQVDAMNTEDSDKAESLRKFFKGLAESRNGLNMPQNMQRIFYDQVSLGTQFVKVPFLVDQWAFKRPGEAGSEQVVYVRHKGPAVVPIRIEDFFTRPYWKDLQRAPWIGVRYRYYNHELKQSVASGAFDKASVDTILGEYLTAYDDNMVEALSNAGVEASSVGKEEPNREYEIFECNVFWDVDGDGTPEDIKVWVEPETRTVLRSEFNPLSIRDVEPVIYFDDPDNLYAIGVCEMTELLQDEVTSLHNMRLDGLSLTQLKMFKARRGSGIADEEFTPFKVLEMDDPDGDLVAMDFADTTSNCLQSEMMAREYADKVTGASDYMAGFNDNIVKSGASVGGTMFLAQQSNTILGSILQNAETSISNIYQIAFYQCVANKDKLDLSFLSVEDASNVMEVLSMNVEDIPTKFRFTVKATDISKTDEAKKQNFLAMSQMYSMYSEKMFQVVQLMLTAQDPMTKELAQKVFVGSTDFMEKMIEFFDVGDPKDYLPFTDHLKIQMRAMDDVRSEQAQAQREAMRNAGNGQAFAGAGQVVPGQSGAMPSAAQPGLGGTPLPAGAASVAPGGVAG